MNKIANYLLFQIGWFLAVIFQNPWSLLWAVCFLIIHVFVFHNKQELPNTIIIMVIGVLIDCVWQLSPFIEYLGPGLVLPVWIIALWIMFPLTLNHSLYWLKKSPILQSIFGVVGGGGSYVAGTQLGAADSTVLGLALVACAWAIWLPLFYYLLQRPFGSKNNPIKDAKQ